MRIRALACLLLCTLLTGCFFEHPLTRGPSKDINSWLLGVWEGTDSKGKTYRARVVPITSDRYYVSFRSLGRKKTPRGVWEFEGWISRVSYSRFLSLKCSVTSGEIPEGAYVFVNYQVIDQNTVITRRLELGSPPEATSQQIREEVRQRLRDNSLMPDEGLKWKRTSEVYWDPLYTEEQPFQPLRFPTPRPDQTKQDRPRDQKKEDRPRR
jgi:hypothetical protein